MNEFLSLTSLSAFAVVGVWSLTMLIDVVEATSFQLNNIRSQTLLLLKLTLGLYAHTEANIWCQVVVNKSAEFIVRLLLQTGSDTASRMEFLMSFREIFLKTGWGFPGGLEVGESPPATAGTWAWLPVQEDPMCCGTPVAVKKHARGLESL